MKLALGILRSSHSISCTGLQCATSLSVMQFLDDSEEAEEICRGLLQTEPELINQRCDKGNLVVHYWTKGNKLWPFKCLLESYGIITDVKRVFVDSVVQMNNDGEKPLQVLAEGAASEESASSEFLINIYKQEVSSQESNISEDQLPWLIQDNKGDTPLSLAIDRQYEKFAMYILLMDEIALINCQKNVLFLAIEKICPEDAAKIMEIIDKQGGNELINDQQNVLHLAPLCTNLLELWEKIFISLRSAKDKNENTPLHLAIMSGDIAAAKFLMERCLASEFRQELTIVNDMVARFMIYYHHKPIFFMICYPHKPIFLIWYVTLLAFYSGSYSIAIFLTSKKFQRENLRAENS